MTEHEVNEVRDDFGSLQHGLGRCQARFAYVQEHLEEDFESGSVLRAFLYGQFCLDQVREQGQSPFLRFDAL